ICAFRKCITGHDRNGSVPVFIDHRNKKFMQKIFLTALFVGIMLSNAQFKYPTSFKEATIDDYHGTKVPDPYRWLEDDNSEKTKDWVKRQNTFTLNYLDKIPFRKDVRRRLEQLWDYPKYSSPFNKGDWYYFFKNDGLQNQSVMYRQKGLDTTPEEFLNPHTI